MIEHRGFDFDPETGEMYRRLGWPNRKDGYLYVTTGKIHRPIHRLMWEAVHGEIPDGMTINHKNGQKLDNRIDNLELLTRAENVLHAREVLGLPAGWATGHGRRGSTKKLTAEQEAEIHRKRKDGVSVATLAKEYGVSRSLVYNITSGLVAKR